MNNLILNIICFIKNSILKLLILFPDKLALHIQYFVKFKSIMRLKRPVTFNEKVNWRKVNQHDERFICFADKVTVKQYVSSLVGIEYVVQTLWVGDNPDLIPFCDLVPPYVIKTNHGCGNIIFINSTEDIDKYEIKGFLSKVLKTTYGKERREWVYQQITPKILIEKMLKSAEGMVPDDYKFFVYNGCVNFIQLDSNRFEDHRMAFFDRNWNKLPFTKAYPQIDGIVSRPIHLELMIEVAEKIGESFDFARVDLYDTPSGVFFGEVTFYPAGGFGRFYPDKWDVLFGEPWKI